MKNNIDQQYIIEKAQSESPEDLIGKLLFRLIQLQNAGNQGLNGLNDRQHSRHGEAIQNIQMTIRQQEEIKSILEEIKKIVDEKDIDLAEVVNGLSQVDSSIQKGNSRVVDRMDTLPFEIPETKQILLELVERVKDNKPNDVVFDGVIEAQKKSTSIIGEMLSKLTGELKKKEYPKKISIDGFVDISKPSWWKSFEFSWEPLKELLEKIKAHTFSVKVINQQEKEEKIDIDKLAKKIGGEVERAIKQIPRSVGMGNPFTFNGDKLKIDDEDIIAALPEKNENGGTIISTSQDKFRDEFLDYDTVENWTEIQKGAGQDISVDGLLNGARYLKINSGVGEDEETILLSKISFAPPFRICAGISLSQRIVNQQFFLEVVQVDEEGNVVELDTPFAVPEANNCRNWAAFIWDGTTTANARIGVRAQGLSAELPVAQSFGTNSGVATGTTPNFLQAFNFEIICNNEFVAWQANAVNSLTAGTTVKRTTSVINPNRTYAIRIRVKNVGIPASATDFRVHLVRVLDASRVSVDFGIVGGRVDAQNAIPVALTSQAIILTSTALAPSTSIGASTKHTKVCTNSTNATSVKNAAGTINSMVLSNKGAAVAFLKLFNKTSAPTVGTDTPVENIMIPAGSTITIECGTYSDRFATGIAYAVTAGIALLDTSAIPADEVTINMIYT